MRTVLVTGIDTGVGKTVVGAALARVLAATGLRVTAVKPLETGTPEGAPSDDEDGVRLAVATGQAAPRAALLRLRTPVAPPVAAELEGVTLDWRALVDEATRLAAGSDVLLLEGAGGALSPLAFEPAHGDVPSRVIDALEIARACAQKGGDLAAVVIAPDRLGVLHHVRAVRAVLAQRGVRHALTLLVAPATPDASTGTNAAALTREPHADRVVGLPFVRSAADAQELERRLAVAVDALTPDERLDPR